MNKHAGRQAGLFNKWSQQNFSYFLFLLQRRGSCLINMISNKMFNKNTSQSSSCSRPTFWSKSDLSAAQICELHLLIQSHICQFLPDFSKGLVTGRLLIWSQVRKASPMVKMLLCLHRLLHIPHKQVSHWNPRAGPTGSRRGHAVGIERDQKFKLEVIWPQILTIILNKQVLSCLYSRHLFLGVQIKNLKILSFDWKILKIGLFSV